jgi:PAS domain S-box-containing protein
MIALIAAVDWSVLPHYSIGMLYAVAMLLIGTGSPGWAIAAAALLCSCLRESFAPFAGEPEWQIRIAFSWFTFLIAGLFARSLSSHSKLKRSHRDLQRAHEDMRHASEQHLQAVVNAIPLGVITLQQDGTLLLANKSSYRILGETEHSLTKEQVLRRLPELTRADARRQSTEAESPDIPNRLVLTRSDGKRVHFLAWMCSHRSIHGVARSWVLWDDTDDMRARETETLGWVNNTSGLLLASAMHEVRNLASAALIACEGALAKTAAAGANELRVAAEAIRGVQSLSMNGLTSLNPDSSQYSSVSLQSVLEDTRVIIEPTCASTDVELAWQVTPQLSLVRGDGQSILQILLNLLRNSIEALRGVNTRRIRVSTACDEETVTIYVDDTGSGVADPDFLFLAHSPVARGAGLGLFISRALARGMGAELQYEPSVLGGACFSFSLRIAQVAH